MKRVFYIVIIASAALLSISLAYYLTYYIPHRDGRKIEAEINEQNIQYCSCLSVKARKISEEKGRPERCTNNFPNDSVNAVKCIRAGEWIDSIEADKECKVLYPKSTKVPDLDKEYVTCK